MDRILFLAHRIPYPPNKGDKIRSFHEVKYLAKHYRIHLAALADDHEDLKYISNLQKFCEKVSIEPIKKPMAQIEALKALIKGDPLSVRYFYSPRLHQKVQDWLRKHRYRAIFCFSSQTAQYLPAVLDPETRFIMDFVDVDSEKWFQYAERTRQPFYRWLYRLEGKRLRKFEREIALRADACLLAAEREKVLFQRLYPEISAVYTVTNGVDLDFFDPKRDYPCPFDPSDPVLVFSGAMDYYANVDGVVWFAKEIFPKVKSHFPRGKFYIIGRKPAPEVLALRKEEGIVVTGFVNDVRPYYAWATACVVPLLVARGIQNKVLEAMAMAKPVVATSQAFEGIKAKPGHDILVADEPQAFAQALIEILKDPNRQKELGQAARKIMEEKYSWEKNLRFLDHLLRDTK